MLDDLAENSKETALNEIPETGQAIENQALANELENLAEAAQNLAGELEETGLKDIKESLINFLRVQNKQKMLWKISLLF